MTSFALIKSWKAIALTSLVVLSASKIGLAQEWQELAGDAEMLSYTGEFAKADALYAEALAKAPDRTAQSKLYLGWARTSLKRAQLSKQPEESLGQAAALYERAIELLGGRERLAAQVNLGAVYLRLEDYEKAESRLKPLQADVQQAFDQRGQARYLYNLARSRDGLEKKQLALRGYRRAYRSDPQFAPAARAAFRLILEQEPSERSIKDLARFTDRVSEGPLPLIVEPYLKTALSRPEWLEKEAGLQLAPALVRFFVRSSTAPGPFKANWEESLKKAARQSPLPSRQALGHILQIYQGHETPLYERHEIEERFKGLVFKAGLPVETLAGLFRLVGDEAARSGAPKTAYAGYLNAWVADSNDFASGAKAIGLLLSAGKAIDPNGNELDQALEFLFREKQGAYYSLDSLRILQMHTLIGRVLEERPELQTSGGLFSTAYHWRRAEQVYEELKTEDPKAVKDLSGLLLGLGRYHASLGDKIKASNYYLGVAEQAYEKGQEELAKETRDKAERLSIQDRPIQLDQRLKRLDNLLQVK